MANAKGISLVDMVKFLRVRREAAEPLLPEPLRHYLDEQVSIAQWYPEEDMIGLVRVLAQVIPSGDEPPLRLIGRLNARNHIAGAYAHLFEGADVAVLPIRARTLWSAMHDTGELRMVVEDGQANITISDYGYPNAELCEMIEPYLEELFLASGLEKADIHKQSCCLTGASVCRYLATWETEAGAG